MSFSFDLGKKKAKSFRRARTTRKRKRGLEEKSKEEISVDFIEKMLIPKFERLGLGNVLKVF